MPNVAHSIDHLKLKSYFKKPCETVDTSGTGQGVIVKFADFYLKVYEDDHDYAYTIYWYGYGRNVPFKVDHVNQNHFREWVESANL